MLNPSASYRLARPPRLWPAVRADLQEGDSGSAITSGGQGRASLRGTGARKSALDTPGGTGTVGGKPERLLAAYVVPRCKREQNEKGRALSDDDISRLLQLCDLDNELVGATEYEAGRFAWPDPVGNSARNVIRHESRGVYVWLSRRKYSEASIECSKFICEGGTPLRKLTALMRLCERDGCRLLATEGFIFESGGRVALKTGLHPLFYAPRTTADPLDTPGCMYSRQPARNLYFCVMPPGDERKVPGAEIRRLLTLFESDDDLRGARESYAAEGGFSWPGTKESCEAYYSIHGRLPTPFECNSLTQEIRSDDDVYNIRGVSTPCALFICKYGTPLRRLVALMRLCEREGYPILATYGFVVKDGHVSLKNGLHKLVKASELEKLKREQSRVTSFQTI